MILTWLFIIAFFAMIIKLDGGILIGWLADLILGSQEKKETKDFIEEVKKEADTKDKKDYNFRWDV